MATIPMTLRVVWEVVQGSPSVVQDSVPTIRSHTSSKAAAVVVVVVDSSSISAMGDTNRQQGVCHASIVYYLLLYIYIHAIHDFTSLLLNPRQRILVTALYINTILCVVTSFKAGL
jgi:hypothetical protein